MSVWCASKDINMHITALYPLLDPPLNASTTDDICKHYQPMGIPGWSRPSPCASPKPTDIFKIFQNHTLEIIKRQT